MLTIYHIEGRRSERIVWFCEEVSLPYKLEFKSGDLHASIAMIREVNPLMPMAPTVLYDDQVMVESAAILQYLQAKHAQGRLAPPADSPDYFKYLQWLHFAEGSAATRMITEFMIKSVKGGELSMVAKMQLGRSEQVLRYLEDYLGKHPYFGGQDFSIADIMMHSPIQIAQFLLKTDLASHPRLSAWLAKLEARPAFKKMREVSLPNGHIGIPQ